MNDILDTILKDTFTLLQLRHRLRVLKSYLLKAIFGSSDNKPLSQQDLNWLSLLPESFYKSFSKDNIYTIFDETEKQSYKIPTLTIYLPFEATDNICLLVGSYARKTFQNPKLLLDAKFDLSLIAGTALVWKGVYRDYSLRAAIEARKEEILTGFKKYLR